MTYKSDAFMVPSSNRLGNGPLKAEMRVRTSLESPNAVSKEDKGIHRANGKNVC